MFDFVTSFLSEIVSAPLSWFTTLLEECSLDLFYLSMAFIVIMYFRILKPLVGSAGSDKVKKPKSAKKEKKG